MLQHNLFRQMSPERMHSDNVSSVSPNVNIKPIVVNKPSNFSIEHILNNAGSPKNKCTTDFNKSPCDDLQHYNDTNHCFYMDSNGHQYPPILDWLQYTRYKPPRLPRPVRNGPVKRTPGRLPRIPFTPHQLNELELAYKRANYLSSEDANRLAIQLDLTCVRVKIWFQNRRARERREKKELNTSSSSSSLSSPLPSTILSCKEETSKSPIS